MSEAGVIMQVPDEQKRLRIIAAAAELFAAQPFHKVLLSDVAETAGVGKGTLYIYFKNKDDLYLSVLYSGFDELVAELQRRLDQERLDPWQHLEAAVGEIVRFAYRNPYMFELMRSVRWCDVLGDDRWKSKRSELKALMESIIRRGIASGAFDDPHPELTARFIPGMVRSVLVEEPPDVDPQTLIEHILRLTRAALAQPGGEQDR
jgi:AcrR family transcriptional regulator